MSETNRAGELSRRTMLLALAASVAAQRAGAQTTAPAIATRRLNNVMIAVSDMTRSVAFYRQLFGAPVEQNGVAVFPVGGGPHFFALRSAANGAKPGYVSFGMTVDDFDPQRLLTTLSRLGVARAEIVPRDGTPELFLPDPDGIRIQLQHAAYGHGSGPRGDVLTPPRGDAQPVFQLKTLNHVTLTVTNGMRSREFYQRVFGLPVQTMQGAGAILAIGNGPDSVVVGGGNNAGPGGVNHVCFTMDNFDPGRVMGTLIDHGLQPIEYGNAALIKPLTCRVRLRQQANNGGGPTSPLGTAELYLNDPDNIPIQIQDVSYCGGSGWLGQICP